MKKIWITLLGVLLIIALAVTLVTCGKKDTPSSSDLPGEGGSGSSAPADPCANGHDEIAHEAKAASCTAVGWDAYVTCSRCDYTTKVEIPALGHDEATKELVGNETKHWYVCKNCKNEESVVTVPEGNTPVAHSYDKKIASEEARLEGTGDCTIPATYFRSCECGKIDTDTKNVFDGTTPGHAWADTILAQNANLKAVANCTNATVYYKVCSIEGCGVIAKEDILTFTSGSPLGHTEKAVTGKAATCTETGLTDGTKCTVCGETVVAQKEISATGHDYDDGVVITKPTCEEKGVKTFTCKNDSSHTHTVYVDATGHTEETIPGKVATCTETGLTAGTRCSVCGETLVAQEEILAKGHTEETVPGKAATCTETGLTAGTKCSVCGETFVAQEEIPAKGHTEETVPSKAATCTETGLTAGTRCSVCGETLVAQEEIPAKGHTEETIPGKAATCTETGLTAGTKCSVCGETLVAQEEIPAKGHTEETIPGKAATCTETGITDGTKCSVCGETLVAQEEIPAKGHTEETIPGKAATCTETGITDGTKCSVCGETLVAQTEIPATGHDYYEPTKDDLVAMIAIGDKVVVGKSVVAELTAHGSEKNTYKLYCLRCVDFFTVVEIDLIEDVIDGEQFENDNEAYYDDAWSVVDTFNTSTHDTSLTQLGQDIYSTGKNFLATSSMTIDGIINTDEGWVCVTPNYVTKTLANTYMSAGSNSGWNSSSVITHVTSGAAVDNADYMPDIKYYVAQSEGSSDEYIHVAFEVIAPSVQIDGWVGQFRLGFNPNDYTQQLILYANAPSDALITKGMSDNSTVTLVSTTEATTAFTQAVLTSSAAKNGVYEITLSKTQLKAAYLAVFNTTLTDADLNTMFVGVSLRVRLNNADKARPYYGTLLTSSAASSAGENTVIPDVIVFGEEKDTDSAAYSSCSFTGHSIEDRYLVAGTTDTYYHACTHCGMAGAKTFKMDSDTIVCE